MQELPEWAETIFRNEYEIEETHEVEHKAKKWLKDNIVGDSFSEFYEEVVASSPSQIYTPGKNRTYSIRNLEDGEPLNCEGAATVGALAAELAYDKDLEVVAEWSLGQQEKNLWTPKQPRGFMGHVTLQDPETGERFGNPAGYMEEHLPLSATAGFYLVNMADEEKRQDSDIEPYLSKLKDLEVRSSYLGNRRSQVEGTA